MENSTVTFDRTPEGDSILAFAESLDHRYVSTIWSGVLRSFGENHLKNLLLDFSRVKSISSAGIAFLNGIERHCRQRGIEVHYRSVPPAVQRMLRYVERDPPELPEQSAWSVSVLVAHLGEMLWGHVKDFHALVQFIGAFTVISLKNATRARRFRWREMFLYLETSGYDAMPILTLLSFLMGLVIAFQAAVQLRQFGANIFVADLVSLSITRELGPLLTALILAGRSGSAFAAELGTMKVNEEVDALVVMGFDTTEFLVLPKVFALCIAGPLLTLLADAAGIMGGIVVGIVGLDLTAASFMEETLQILTLRDVSSGLMKSLAFAGLVSLIGCFRGLQTTKGADSVGRQTTSAVVSGIFLIIVADAVFTVIFQVFDW